jgi:hypothetical protein
MLQCSFLRDRTIVEALMPPQAPHSPRVVISSIKF